MNKSFKKNLIILSAVLSVMLLIGIFTVFADGVSDIGGTIEGTDITWSLSGGVLTLSGSGETPNRNSGGKPWSSYMDSITEVVVEEGITCLGNDAFSSGSSLTTVSLPASLTELKQGVFFACNSISTVYYPGTMDNFKSNVTVAVYNDAIYNATWNISDDSTAAPETAVTPEIVAVTIKSFEEFDGDGNSYSCPWGEIGAIKNLIDDDASTLWGWVFQADMGFIAHFDSQIYVRDIFLQAKDEGEAIGPCTYNVYALVDGDWVFVSATDASSKGSTVQVDLYTSAIKVTIPEWNKSVWAQP